jgi:hypothetical protein
MSTTAHSKFHRRLLTIMAIAMMLCSSLISFFVVQQDDRHISDLKREAEKAEQDIRATWDTMLARERRADMAVIVSLLADNASPAAGELKAYYRARAGIEKQGAPLMDVLKASDGERDRSVDAINTVYEKHLDMQGEITRLEERNKLIANLAFFLQLVSLVLVILTREMPGV